MQVETDAHLQERSHPGSPRYGQYYTPEEVVDIFAPSRESIDAVHDWLSSSGVSSERISQSANKQWIQFDADAGKVERLLKTE